MAVSKHRKKFKAKQQKNQAQKISDKKLLAHRIQKYQELMMEEMVRQQEEKENPTNIVVDEENPLLPHARNISAGSFMDMLSEEAEVEVIESVKPAKAKKQKKDGQTAI